MTVAELKKKLSVYNDDLEVLIPMEGLGEKETYFHPIALKAKSKDNDMDDSFYVMIETE